MRWWWRRNDHDAAELRAAAEQQHERIIREGDIVDTAADRMAQLPTDEFLRRMIIAFGRHRT